MHMMRAWMIRSFGGPEVFELVERPIPTGRDGWVLVQVEAFGLNRSELFSRRGMSSPDFSLPRVLGLECVGRVIQTTGDLGESDRVVCLMGGMGRSFDGGYATHALVPRTQVFKVDTALGAAELGAVPETYNTAYGVCIESLALDGSDTVLIRGGTSALGMACADIAKDLGCRVATTTRSQAKAEILRQRTRADWVIVDGSDIAATVLATCGPMTAVVECVGAKATIESSCATMTRGGKLGLVGQLSETWNTDEAPEIPAGVTKTFTRSDLVASPGDDARMQTIVSRVEAGRYRPNIHHAFTFDELPEAHRRMGANEAIGKLVVCTGA
ncbi:MAG: zinc-binding dehydrogenase [Myxococcales bacterium]|nr:zinc-binding dehydrogenase [Myxococcales bacterium]